MTKPMSRLAAAVALAVLAASPANAASTPIAGPGNYLVGATTFAEEPDLGGLIIADRLQPFTITGQAGAAATGTLQERVVRSDSTGFLHFYHRVIIETASGFEPGSYIEWLEFNPAATSNPLSVGRRTDGTGSATATRYDIAASGFSRFDYNLIFLDGSEFSTQFHYWKTTATDFALTGEARLRGFEYIGFTEAFGIGTPWLATYAPAVVPEPLAWALMVTGFGLVGGTLRQRRRAAAA